MKLDRLDYTVLIVEHLDRALFFYEQLLGLPVKHRAEAYAQLEVGETRLGLYTRAAMQETLGRALAPPARNAPSCELGFLVADVDAAYGELVAAGAEPVTPPADRPWGQRTAYLADPDGHLIELVENLPAAIRGAT